MILVFSNFTWSAPKDTEEPVRHAGNEARHDKWGIGLMGSGVGGEHMGPKATPYVPLLSPYMFPSRKQTAKTLSN